MSRSPVRLSRREGSRSRSRAPLDAFPTALPQYTRPRDDASPPGENVLPGLSSGIPRAVVQGTAAFCKVPPFPSPISLRDTEKATSEPRGKEGRRRLPAKKTEKLKRKANENCDCNFRSLFGVGSFFLAFLRQPQVSPPARDGGHPGKRARVRRRGPCPPYGRHGGGGRRQPLPTTKIAASPCGRGFFICFFFFSF